MKISVITVCYNAAAELEQTMLSVLGQTHPDVEYIVIDGSSTDGSVDIIKKYADRLTYWVSEPDRGIYDAMNKGIARATGAYLNFMNAGDRFASEDVLAQIVAINPSADIVYGDTFKHDAKRRWEDLSHPAEVLRYHGAFCHQSALVSTAYHKEHLFDLQYKYMADFNLFHRAYMTGATFEHIPIYVAEYNQEYGASLSQINENYLELDKILADTDTLFRKIRRRIKHSLGRIKRMMK